MGRLVLVVGPSGAGKDTLINRAKEALKGDPRFYFVRRVVTRAADAAAEDHDTLAADSFATAKAEGAFALDWEAHGLKYALPRSIEDEVAAGRVVVANGSRRMVAEALARYPDAQILLIDAPPQVRAGRLARRGRETVAAISERLAREGLLPVGIEVTTIDNSGTVEMALDAFISAISPQE